MALINCPECGKNNVSDSANFCPNCGYNIKEHFKKLNKEIAKKQKNLKKKKHKVAVFNFILKLKTLINRFKSFSVLKKCTCLLITCAIVAGIIGVVNISSILIKKSQIQTFSSKESMIESVIGDYVDAEHFDNPFVFCTINENYVSWNNETFIMSSDTYAIKKWDYENGKIIYGDDNEFEILKNGNIENKIWTFSKKNYHYNLDFEISDIKWSEESEKTKCLVTINGTIQNPYSKRIKIEGKAFANKSTDEQNKDLLNATNTEETLSRNYYFTNSIVEFEFDLTEVERIYIVIKEDDN